MIEYFMYFGLISLQNVLPEEIHTVLSTFMYLIMYWHHTNTTAYYIYSWYRSKL